MHSHQMIFVVFAKVRFEHVRALFIVQRAELALVQILAFMLGSRNNVFAQIFL